MKNLCKVVADLPNFVSILEEMWNSNAQLSQYQYPLIVQGNSQRKFVYIGCRAGADGCSFQLKLKLKTTSMTGPDYTVKDAQWRAKLKQLLSPKNPTTNQVTYYRTIVFKNEHNHSTMKIAQKNPQKISNILSSISAPPLQNGPKFDLEKEKLNRIFQHYKRKRGNWETGRLGVDVKGNGSGSGGGSGEGMKGVGDFGGKQEGKLGDSKRKLFGDNVIFLCDYQAQYCTPKEPNNPKIQQQQQPKKQHKQKQPKPQSSGYEIDDNLTIKSSSSSSQPIKGDPYLYFYSSPQMQKNLQKYSYLLNILHLQSSSDPAHDIIIFGSMNNNKQFAIFAVAVLCNRQYGELLRKSVIRKFFDMAGAEKVEVVVLGVGVRDWLEGVLRGELERRGWLEKIEILYRLSYCLEVLNCQDPEISAYYRSKNEKICAHFYQQNSFTRLFTQSFFQYLYHQQKQLQPTPQSSPLPQPSQPLPKKYPLQFLYLPISTHLQKTLLKMSQTLSMTTFTKHLLSLIHNYCHVDEHFSILHQHLLKYKDKIFLSQMRRRKFLGINFAVDLENCVEKYFGLGKLAGVTNQKMVRIVITRALEGAGLVVVEDRFWVRNGGDVGEFQGDFGQSRLQQIIARNRANVHQLQQFQRQLTPSQILLLKKHPLLRSIYILLNTTTPPMSPLSPHSPQSHKSVMKRLPFFNQSALYMSFPCRYLLFDVEIMNMLQYSWIDLTDRTVVACKSYLENDISSIIWNHNQICGVWKNRHTGNLWVCQCGYSDFFRMPCRHIIKAMIKYQFNIVTYVNQFWHQK